MMRRTRLFLLVGLCALLAGCGGGGGSTPAPVTPTLPPSVAISAASSTPVQTGATRTFTATVSNATNNTVSWSVVEAGGGSITQAGVYTAPADPGTFTVKATLQSDATVTASVPVAVVIPMGHIPGYDVGVDYHATTADFTYTTFTKIYNQPAVRDEVKRQLQGIADRGATFVSTRIWMVTNPGETDFGHSWRTTFPMTDQEKANLRQYAQDVAAVKGSGGNQLRLDLCLLWLGAADYMMGTPETGLGFSNLLGPEFTSRVNLTVDKVIEAVSDVKRPDGVNVVDTIYLDGEVMIGAKANQDWFMRAHYPRFVQRVQAAGLKPAVYFISNEYEWAILDDAFVDVDYPILNGHRSMFWIYRTLKFMADEGMYIPSRIDFSWYVASPTASTPMWTLLNRTLDDADATLPSLGAPRAYGAAETQYFLEYDRRRILGQAFAGQAALNPRMKRVAFWTTPDAGGPGIGVAYPFHIEDYCPPLN